MNFWRQSFTNKKYLYSTITIVALVAYSTLVYGAQLANGTPPPTGGYAAGDSILDPGCAPGSSNCFQNVGTPGWGLTGNSGTDGGATNFIGTTDAEDLVLKSDNNEVAHFYDDDTGKANVNSISLGNGAVASGSDAFVAGFDAGSGSSHENQSVFIGDSAGSGASGDGDDVYVGDQAGTDVGNHGDNAFVGAEAGANISGGANETAFFGFEAGDNDTGNSVSAFQSLAIGTYAGLDARNTGDTFVGNSAGSYSGVNSSIFIGASAGLNTANASNSIFIGNSAGENDSVDDTQNGSADTSILIGNGTSTGGYKNSIALGYNATNTMSDQFLVAPTYTNWDIAGVNYAWPTSQAGAAGDVLTNDGSGNLSWTAPSGGGGGSSQWTTSGSDIYSNNAGNVGIGTTTPGSQLEVDGSFSDATAGGASVFTSDNWNGYGLTGATMDYVNPSNSQDAAVFTTIGLGASATTLMEATDSTGASLGESVNSSISDMLATSPNGDQIHAQFSMADGFVIRRSQLFVAPSGLFSVTADNSGTANAYFKINDTGQVFMRNLSAAGSDSYTPLCLDTSTYEVVTGGCGGGGGGGGSPEGIDSVLSQNQSFTQARSMDINGNSFTIEDSQAYPDGLFNVNDNGQSYLGDYNGDENGTYFKVDDGAEAYTFSQPNFSIAGISYVFPSSQAGATGDVLTNDGSGNLSWALAGSEAGLIGSTDGVFNSGSAGSSSETWLGYGAGSGSANNYNTVFVGYGAGDSATGAFSATFIGPNAGNGATIANNGIFIGDAAGMGATNAYGSSFIGFNAGEDATLSNNSSFIGPNAGNSATNANNSEFIGDGAGNSATNANNSIFIGNGAGASDTVNNSSSGTSILIGDNTSTGGFSNSIALGAYATNSAINQLMIGSNTSPINSIVMNSTGQTGCTIVASGLSCSSDERLKTNITDLPTDTLDTLDKVRTVTFNWDSDPSGPQNIGFLAQDIQQYYPDVVSTGANGYLQVNYAAMAPVLVEADRELDLKLSAIEGFATATDTTFLTEIENWLASATNGIANIFSQKVTTNQLCIGQTCINESDLQQFKAWEATQSQGSSGGSPTVVTPSSGGDGGSSDPSSGSASSTGTGGDTTPSTGSGTGSASSGGSTGSSDPAPDPTQDPSSTPSSDPSVTPSVSTPDPTQDPSQAPTSDPVVTAPASGAAPAVSSDPVAAPSAPAAPSPDPSSDGSGGSGN